MKAQRKLAPNQAWQLDLAGKIPARVDAQAIGTGDALAPEQVLRFATEHGVKHICQKQGPEFATEMASAELIVQSPDQFRRCPVATILAPSTSDEANEKRLITVDANFDCSDRKRDVLEEITRSMTQSGHGQTLIEDVVSVADELFTNAVFNAPFVDMVTQINPGVNRHDTRVQFDAGKSARLFLAQDQSRLVIGCEDPFGSLNLQTYLGKIKDTYVKGPAATMNFGPGGAGLGSYIIFNAGSSLYFGVWPGQATVLCCVIPLRLSLRKRALLPKNLHWIQP